MHPTLKIPSLVKCGASNLRLVNRLAHSDSSVTLRSEHHQRHTRVAEIDPDAEFSPTHSPAAKAVARSNRIHLSLDQQPGVALGEMEVALLVNGMTVASIPTEFPAYHVQLAVKAGPRYEEPWSLGVSHVTRRMFGLASKPFRFAINQNRTLQQLGAHVECKGSREMTLYQLSQYKFKDEAIDIAATAFAYAATMPAFYPWEISRNMQMLKLDAADVRGSTAQLIDQLHSVAYKGTLGNSLWCPEHRMGDISADTVEQYYQKFYTPDRFALVGIGVPIGALKDMAHKFCFLEPQSPATQSARWRAGESRVDNGNPCVQIAIGMQGASLGDAGASSMQTLLAGLLTNALSVQGNNGPAVVTPVNLQYSDAGLFGLHIVCHYLDAGDVVQQAAQQLSTFGSQGVTDQQLANAKATVRRLAAEQQLNPHQRLTDISAHLLYGSAADQSAAVDKVTKEQLGKQVKDLLKSGSGGQLAMASIGKLDTVPFKDEIQL